MFMGALFRHVTAEPKSHCYRLSDNMFLALGGWWKSRVCLYISEDLPNHQKLLVTEVGSKCYLGTEIAQDNLAVDL